MPSARVSACDRLSAARNAIAQFKLQDMPLVPANASHNDAVRIIRSGLAVQCFNILEDFVKARVAEALDDISSSGVPFRYLPAKLQRASTVDAIKAIDFQARLRDKADRIRYAQQYSSMVASTGTSPITMPSIAFFHASSNISTEHFRDALAAFAIDKPWDQLSGLTSRIGLSAIPAENVFDNLAQRRHQAAHDASASVSEADLSQSLSDAFAIAICFDILVSKATQELVGLRRAPATPFHTVADHRAIPLRFIRAAGKRFAELREGRKRSTRVGRTWTALLPDASNRAKRENGALVVYGNGGAVMHWTV